VVCIAGRLTRQGKIALLLVSRQLRCWWQDSIVIGAGAGVKPVILRRGSAKQFFRPSIKTIFHGTQIKPCHGTQLKPLHIYCTNLNCLLFQGLPNPPTLLGAGIKQLSPHVAVNTSKTRLVATPLPSELYSLECSLRTLTPYLVGSTSTSVRPVPLL